MVLLLPAVIGSAVIISGDNFSSGHMKHDNLLEFLFALTNSRSSQEDSFFTVAADTFKIRVE